MATREQMIQALKIASDNGDKQSALKIANMIKQSDLGGQQQNVNQQPVQTQPQTITEQNNQAIQNLQTKIRTPVQERLEQNKQQGLFVPRQQIESELTGQNIPEVTPSGQPVSEEPSGFETGLNAAGTIISGAIAEPVAGLAGLATVAGTKIGNFLGLTDEVASDVGTDVINSVKDFIQIKPNAETQEILTKVAETIAPITKAVGESSERSADFYGELARDLLGEDFEVAGKTFGKTLHSLTEIAAETVVGAGAGKVVGDVVETGKDVVKTIRADVDADTQVILDAAKEANIPVLTTDILEPTTSAGKILQTVNERIPVFGTGGKRAKQQAARTSVVEDLIEDLKLDKGSTPEIDIVDDIIRQNGKKLEAAKIKRGEAIDSLITEGKVSTRQTKKLIDDVVGKERAIGTKKIQDTETIDFLEGIKDSITSRDFGELASVRTTLINRINTVRRSEDQGSLPKLQRIKSAIDRDMKSFGNQKNKEAINKWNESNQQFADELTAAKETSLKNILKKGEFDERKVKTIIESGSVQQLKTLKNALSPVGIKKVKDSIFKNALDESGSFDNVNPDRFVTAMQKLKKDKALSAFLDVNDKKKLDGLIKVMDATRRAQTAAANIPTGSQLLTVGATGGTLAGVFAPSTIIPTLIGGATLKGINKVYNSAPVRNLLIKFANVKKGSKAENKLMKELGALVGAADLNEEETK